MTGFTVLSAAYKCSASQIMQLVAPPFRAACRAKNRRYITSATNRRLQNLWRIALYQGRLAAIP